MLAFSAEQNFYFWDYVSHITCKKHWIYTSTTYNIFITRPGILNSVERPEIWRRVLQILPNPFHLIKDNPDGNKNQWTGRAWVTGATITVPKFGAIFASVSRDSFRNAIRTPPAPPTNVDPPYVGPPPPIKREEKITHKKRLVRQTITSEFVSSKPSLNLSWSTNYWKGNGRGGGSSSSRCF